MPDQPTGPADSAGSPGSPDSPDSPGPPSIQVQVDLAVLEAQARLLIGEMPYAYYSGGAEDERLLAENVTSWSRWRLHPRVLVDVTRVTTATTVLGAAVRSPLMVAPTAIQGLAHEDGEVATARGAAAAGACSVLSSLATRSLEDVAEATPDAVRWMQVYILKDRERTASLAERAAAAGYRALVLTVDAPVSGLRQRELRAGVHLPHDLALPNLTEASTDRAREGGFMAVVAREFDPGITYDDIGWLRDVSGLPVVVKGVLRSDDAVRCVEAGAVGVIVSNHGARQLNDAPATADVLVEVVDAVDDRAEIYVDGGIRRGADVAKALAMGARGVLLGRPVLWALASGGQEGVTALLSWFESELLRVMALCGAPCVADLDRSLVRPGPGPGSGT